MLRQEFRCIDCQKSVHGRHKTQPARRSGRLKSGTVFFTHQIGPKRGSEDLSLGFPRVSAHFVEKSRSPTHHVGNDFHNLTHDDGATGVRYFRHRSSSSSSLILGQPVPASASCWCSCWSDERIGSSTAVPYGDDDILCCTACCCPYVCIIRTSVLLFPAFFCRSTCRGMSSTAPLNFSQKSVNCSRNSNSTMIYYHKKSLSCSVMMKCTELHHLL